jgi:hypothetical protein
VGRADLPGGLTPSSLPQDGGGDGHPWDDGTVENDPADSTIIDQPVESSEDQTIVPMAVFGMESSGTLAVRGAIMGLWRRIVSSEISVIRNSGKVKLMR